MGSTIDISVSLLGDDPFGVICRESSGNQSEQLHMMNQTSSGKPWTLTLEVPPEAYSVHMVFGPFSTSDHLMIFYPSWGMRDYRNRPDPTPSARVALADLSPDLLSPGSPIWCGADLWVLPVMNTSDQVQDISLCRFQLGNPHGNVFVAESVLVGSHETFYLTNSRRRAETIYTEHNIYGDAGTSYPQGTTLTLMDPSWNPIYSWQIEEGDSLPETNGLIIPSEASTEDEWLELFNNSEYSVNVSRWYLMDSEKNISFIPDDFVLLPGEILLAAACPDSFENLFCKVVPLDFNLNTQQDSLSLYSQFGDLVFSFGWDDSWPIKSSGIMYLESPSAAVRYSHNWKAAAPPGSPGMINPGWSQWSGYMKVTLLSENPCNGSFGFRYETTSPCVEANLYDLSGRVLERIYLPEKNGGTVWADFSGSLPNGVYILHLRSSTASASVRFTVVADSLL